MKHAGTHQRKTISTVIKKYILKQYFFFFKVGFHLLTYEIHFSCN